MDKDKILKGLECHMEIGNCVRCPYDEEGRECSRKLAKEAKELIDSEESSQKLQTP